MLQALANDRHQATLRVDKLKAYLRAKGFKRSLFL